MSAPSFDLSQAHRWFGIEFNNTAWDLVEAPVRTAAETERMLCLAHASCLHWASIGTPANEQRGLVLLALAHAVAGIGTRAVELAKRCLDVGTSHNELLTPFDRAAAAAVMATALRSNHRPADAREWETNARSLLAQVEEDDRPVIQRILTASVEEGAPSRGTSA